MRVAVCDDVQLYVDSVVKCIHDWNKSDEIIIKTFTSSEDLCDQIGQAIPYDIVFLDIQFPGELNGMELARMLREWNEDMIIVFISGTDDYAVDGYRVNAFRYLCKPLSYESIAECLDAAYHRLTVGKKPMVFIDGKDNAVIEGNRIFYIESQGHYLTLHLKENEKLTFRKKLSEIVPALPEELFASCHRSYIVNVMYIRRLIKGEIVLADGSRIPLSPRYRDKVYEKFVTYFQGGI